MPRDKFYARAAREAIRNSLSLVEAGESLLSSEKFGIATSLFVLACEEFAKGMLFSAVADGTASIDPKDLGKKWVVDPGAPSSHTLKQLFAGGAFLTPVLVKSLNRRWPEIEQRLSKTALPEPGTEDFDAILEGLAREYFPEASDDPEAKRRSDLVSRLDSLKLAGLYVEARADSIKTPSFVTKEDATAVLGLYEEILSSHSERALLGVPEQVLRRRLPLSSIFPGGQKRPSFKGATKRSKRRERQGQSDPPPES